MRSGAHHPLFVLLEAKHGQLRGKWQKLVPASPPASTLGDLELLATPQDPPAYVGTGPYRVCEFFKDIITHQERPWQILPKKKGWFLSAGLLLEVCCFFNVNKIHLTSIPTPCKYNCNSQEASAHWNGHAAHRTPTSRILFIFWFQSQAREQVYERLMPPYMAAVSSYFLQKLHFSLSPSTPSSPSIPEMQPPNMKGREGGNYAAVPS